MAGPKKKLTTKQRMAKAPKTVKKLKAIAKTSKKVLPMAERGGSKLGKGPVVQKSKAVVNRLTSKKNKSSTRKTL